jgi:pimeloyl-ACP methyl ester carboxylesterase
MNIASVRGHSQDQESEMAKIDAVTSRDGTKIVFERSGEGPAVILVDGALTHRKLGPSGPYDITIMGDGQQGRPLRAERWAGVTVPTLVIGGARSPVWMRNAVQALAQAVPGAQHRVLAGQTHLVKPDAIAPVLAEFFKE